MRVFQGYSLKSVHLLYMFFDILLESARKYFIMLLKTYFLWKQKKMSKTVLSMPVITFLYFSILFISYLVLGHDICGNLVVLFFLSALFIIF